MHHHRPCTSTAIDSLFLANFKFSFFSYISLHRNLYLRAAGGTFQIFKHYRSRTAVRVFNDIHTGNLDLAPTKLTFPQPSIVSRGEERGVSYFVNGQRSHDGFGNIRIPRLFPLFPRNRMFASTADPRHRMQGCNKCSSQIGRTYNFRINLNERQGVFFAFLIYSAVI
jgi:hypothetical protein